MDPHLLCFFHNGLPGNERCPLPDASGLRDNEKMIYPMKIQIEQAWRTMKVDKGKSADNRWL